MLESVEREIDGITFSYQPLMATPARELLDQLIQKFGPTIAGAVEGLEKADDLNLDDETNLTALLGSAMGSLGNGLRELSQAFGVKFHRDLVEKLGKQTQIKKEETGDFVPFDKSIREIMFGTHLLTEFKWIGFCLEAQYKDFFGLLRQTALQAAALKALANTSRSSSQKDLTGISNGLPQVNDTQAD